MKMIWNEWTDLSTNAVQVTYYDRGVHLEPINYWNSGNINKLPVVESD